MSFNISPSYYRLGMDFQSLPEAGAAVSGKKILRHALS